MTTVSTITSTVREKIDDLARKIQNWYKNAEIDYGVHGYLENIILTNNETIVVNVVEDGERIATTLEWISEYSADQLYNIWMEFA